MGFWKSFKKIGKGVVKDIGGGLDLLSTTFQKPLTTVSTLINKPQDIPKLVKKTKKKPLKKQIGATVVTTALTTGALLSPVRLIPKTIGGAVLTTAGTGAVLSSPKIASWVEPTQNIMKAFTGGEMIAKVVEGDDDKPNKNKPNKNKPDKTLPEGFKEGGIFGAGAVLGGGLVNLLDKDKDIPTPKTPNIPSLLPDKPEIINKEKEVGISGETPLTPETTSIQTGKRRYKRRSKKITPSVRQSVRVNIVNTNQNKRYIKNTLYC